MRVIILDLDPKVSATYLSDTDLKTQIFELSRLLSAVMKDNDREYDFANYAEIYLLRHSLVPKELRSWLSNSRANWLWAKGYFKAMLEEHVARFGFNHTSANLISLFDDVDLEGGEEGTKFTSPPTLLEHQYLIDGNQRTEEEFLKNKGKGKWAPSAVMSYRKWYKNRTNELQWTAQDIPEFLKAQLNTTAGVPNAAVRARR